jgi:RimJ/RimL family protein N-acetyltransferase
MSDAYGQDVLETERLTLRRFTPGDVENLFELDGDPEVMRYITGGRPTPRELIEREELPAFLARSDGYGFWAAVEKASGEFIGWFHLRPRADGAADEPELGYRLRRSAWGKGYATEGSRALVEKAFTDLGAQRVGRRRWWSTPRRTESWRRPDSTTCARSTRTGRTRSKARRKGTSSTR